MNMNGKKKYLIPILFACLIAGQIGVTYAEDFTSHLEVSTKNIYLSAGRHSNVTIQLLNTGSFDLTEIDFQLISATPGLPHMSRRAAGLIFQHVDGCYSSVVTAVLIACA